MAAALAAGILGSAAATVGLAVGRIVAKIDPVGVVCDTCDGPARVLWDVVPGVGPAVCPQCGRSVRAPVALVVVLVGATLAGLGARGDRGWLLVADAVLGGALAGLVWTDARYRLLPARLVWPAVVISLVPLALAGERDGDAGFAAACLTALASGAAFLVLHVLNPEGLAFGDVRLAVLLGLHLGWRSPATAMGAFWLAILVGAVVGLLWRRARGQRTLPFGPFLAAGTAVALLVSAPGPG